MSKADPRCLCNHTLAEHRHTHIVGTGEPFHCSQGCGCLGFTSQMFGKDIVAYGDMRAKEAVRQEREKFADLLALAKDKIPDWIVICLSRPDNLAELEAAIAKAEGGSDG